MLQRRCCNICLQTHLLQKLRQVMQVHCKRALWDLRCTETRHMRQFLDSKLHSEAPVTRVGYFIEDRNTP